MAARGLKCPGCLDADELRRSHMRWYDLPFRLVGMRAYRCLLCYRRFYAWRHPGTRLEAQEPTGTKMV